MKFNATLLMLLLPALAMAQSQTSTRNDAGITGNEGATSGFFETSVPVNYPAGATSWWHLLDVRHSNGNNNYAMQFAGSFFDQNLYFRKTDNWSARPWLKVITEENGNVNLSSLNIMGSGVNSSVGNSSAIASNFVVRASTGGRLFDKGAQLEFVIPANTDGTNPYGQARIITVAGNNSNYNATGKMILGTRRMFDKFGTGQEWYYGDDIVIDGAGRIGIGTLAPQERLSVNGTIRSKEIKVEAANWPDYVFEEDYNIGTLKGLESYIKTNKHLPEMPPAKEVEANGIALGEMNKLLLKKIEELTLHLIEKDHQISNQQKKMDAIEKDLQEIKIFMKNKPNPKN